MIPRLSTFQSVSNKQHSTCICGLSSVLFNVITTAFVICNDVWMKPLGHLTRLGSENKENKVPFYCKIWFMFIFPYRLLKGKWFEKHLSLLSIHSPVPEPFNLYILPSGPLHGRHGSATSDLFSDAWLVCAVPNGILYFSVFRGIRSKLYRQWPIVFWPSKTYLWLNLPC